MYLFSETACGDRARFQSRSQRAHTKIRLGSKLFGFEPTCFESDGRATCFLLNSQRCRSDLCSIFCLKGTEATPFLLFPSIQRSRKENKDRYFYRHYISVDLKHLHAQELFEPFCRVHLYSLWWLSRSLLSITRQGARTPVMTLLCSNHMISNTAGQVYTYIQTKCKFLGTKI